MTINFQQSHQAIAATSNSAIETSLSTSQAKLHAELLHHIHCTPLE